MQTYLFCDCLLSGASRIWNEIHQYNTFHSDQSQGDEEVLESEIMQSPVEHRVFYKAISGLHSSISSHIACGYLLDKDRNIWGLHLDQYLRRLHAHPHRINNLYFVYLMVLRAVEKSSEFFLSEYDFSTGAISDDAETQHWLIELLESRYSWPITFDEEAAFGGLDGLISVDQERMLTEFREKIYNISRIMDCVGCQRCRLWGKLQIMGLGTAFRILYAPDTEIVLRSLHRNHVVALFNLLGRLSHSVNANKIVLPMIQLVGGASSNGQHLNNNEGGAHDDIEAIFKHKFRDDYGF
jgi:hypothetical protein